jgi:hypothetical protein
VKLPDVPATVTPVADAATNDVYAGAIKALGVLESAGVLVRDVASTESRLNQTGKLTPGIHAGLVSAISTVSRAALDAIDKIDQGVTSWEQLRAILQSVLTPVQNLVNAVTAAGSNIKEAFGDVLDLLPGVIRTALPTGGVQ